ncbi:MAG: DUF3047 domain-containing protein [Candidatus Sericytochromatia bacterium]|nr:DUF3047 domain-containing protein [Candidatus Sericytochromatia bacterium]
MTRQWLSVSLGRGAFLTWASREARRASEAWFAPGVLGTGLALLAWGQAAGSWASSLPGPSRLPGERAATAQLPRLLGDFSAAAWASWENTTHLPWDPKNRYTRLDTAEGPVVRVDSQGAASMLLKQITHDAQREPIVSWRWRIAAPLVGGDETSKERDDCAARVYFLWGLRTRADLFTATGVGYVWGQGRRAGQIGPSPYTGQIGVITLRSGSQGAGEWQTERRDLEADYRACHKRPPPGPVTAIAILTDTDQTKVAATAWYSAIYAAPRR